MENHHQDEVNSLGAPQEEKPSASKWFMQLVMLVAILGVAYVIGNILTLAGALATGMDLETLMQGLSEDSPASDRNSIRYLLLVTHLMVFILPAIVFGYIFYRNRSWWFYKMEKMPSIVHLGLAVLIIFCAFPLVQYTYFLNKMIPLPSILIEMEEMAMQLTESLLVMDTPWELILNLIVVAVIPGIGEELIFRGGIQQLLGKIMKNQHVVIWLTAFFFSAFHLQFQGFIPRMLLGGVLGYLFYWSGSLWVAMFAHFVNNGTQVLMQYLFAHKISELNLEEMESVPFPVVMVSLLILIGLFYLLWKMRDTSEEIKLAKHE